MAARYIITSVGDNLMVVDAVTEFVHLYPTGVGFTADKHVTGYYEFLLKHPSFQVLNMGVDTIISINGVQPNGKDFYADCELLARAMSANYADKFTEAIAGVLAKVAQDAVILAPAVKPPAVTPDKHPYPRDIIDAMPAVEAAKPKSKSRSRKK